MKINEAKKTNHSFASLVVGFGSTETPKVAFLLFYEATEANLFVSDSVKLVSYLVMVLSIKTKFFEHPTMWGWVGVSYFVVLQLFRIQCC